MVSGPFGLGAKRKITSPLTALGNSGKPSRRSLTRFSRASGASASSTAVTASAPSSFQSWFASSIAGPSTPNRCFACWRSSATSPRILP